MANFSRDRFVKRIHIEEEHAIPPLLRLTLADPDGRFDETSQVETLLDEIKVANVRKKAFYALSVVGSDLRPNVPEQKINNNHGYSVPVSKKTIFDTAVYDDEKDEKYVSNQINVAGHYNMRVSRVERVEMDSKRHLIAYLEGLYTTLMYIVKLVDMEDEFVSDATMRADGKNGFPHRAKLQAAYTYLLQNYEKKNCQRIILENTVELLDDVSKIATRLIFQKRYNTYEKVRKLLLGVMNMTGSR